LGCDLRWGPGGCLDFWHSAKAYLAILRHGSQFDSANATGFCKRREIACPRSDDQFSSLRHNLSATGPLEFGLEQDHGSALQARSIPDLSQLTLTDFQGISSWSTETSKAACITLTLLLQITYSVPRLRRNVISNAITISRSFSLDAVFGYHFRTQLPSPPILLANTCLANPEPLNSKAVVNKHPRTQIK